jgi:hypothetical protein
MEPKVTGWCNAVVRIGSCLALLGLVFSLAGCGGDDEKSSTVLARTPERIQVDQDRLFGLLWPPGGVGEIQLAKLDPATLAPKSRGMPLEAGGGVTELSPDGSILALAAGEAPQIEFIDLKHMRSLGVADVGMPGYVSRLSWARDGMLFATLGQSAVALVHPASRQLVETRQVDGILLGDAQPIRAGMLALVAPSDRMGLLKVVVFGGKGTFPVPLRGIIGGWETESGDDEAEYTSRGNQPALTVDPTGRRALVVPAEGEVAEVDLANLRVTYHALSQPVSLLERLRNWLEPSAQAKVIEGPIRQAVWMSSGLVAVTGADYTASDGQEATADPAGLSLIDTSDWSVRTINEKVDWVQVAGERLLAFEPGCAGDQESYGLVAYDLEGNEVFDLCRDEGFAPQIVGRYAYLGFNDNTRFEIIDLTNGKVIARPSTARTTSLLEN